MSQIQVLLLSNYVKEAYISEQRVLTMVLLLGLSEGNLCDDGLAVSKRLTSSPECALKAAETSAASKDP